MQIPDDAKVFSSQSFGTPLKWAFPAGLLIVDFVNGFVKPDVFGGYNTLEAAKCTAPVLQAFRDLSWPVIFTRIVYAKDGVDANVFSQKVPAVLALTEDNPDSHVIDLLKPKHGELVINKTVPSAFFGTNLASFCLLHDIRTMVICGATTSGCVRASVIDAMSYGIAPIVLSDCVGDRVESAHQSSLRDMAMKYCDVFTSQDVLTRIENRYK
jgi:maleamate amidohydrolase